MRKGTRTALVICGTVALALGVMGIVLPLLPTTPFLLLAAACYARGSPRLHGWLMNNRFLGEYIRDYRERTAIKRNIKIFAVAMLWLFIGISILAVEAVWLRVLLAAIAVAVTAHIVRLRTIKPVDPPRAGR
ncbi:MAG: YbaN family protein [Chloroflexota bacterium]